METGSRSFHWAAALIVCLTGALLYANSLQTPFVFDDGSNIESNANIRVRELSWEALHGAAFESISKRPVANLSFALNYYAGGYDVTGYHVVNVMIHCVNGVLVYLLALFVFQRLSPRARQASAGPKTPAVWMSLLAALIFCAHPIQTQSVTYIVQRMNSLAAMFYLAALLLYIRGRLSSGGARWVRWAGVGLAWLLALGSKQMVVVFPFTILLIEGYCFQDLRREWLRKWIWAVPAAVALVLLIGVTFLGSLGLEGYLGRDFTLPERLLTELRVVAFYIGLLLYPHPSRLNLTHSFPVSESLVVPITTLLSLLVLLALAAFALRRARQERLLSFCILWFFIHLVVESSFLPLELIFEHRLYLPMFGFALAASDALFRFLGRRPIWAVTVATAVVVTLGTGTVARNRTWGSAITLWQDALKKNPGNYRTHYNLGDAFVAAGRYPEAIEHYTETLRLRRDFGAAHNGLGMAWEARGDVDRAIFHYGEALRSGKFQHRGQGLAPDEAVLNTNLALAHARQGRVDEAITHFLESIRIAPGYAKAHHGLGSLYGRRGDLERAMPLLVEALRIDPMYAAARIDLATAYVSLGELDHAEQHYQELLRRHPAHAADAHAGLGAVDARQGRFQRAAERFDEALRIQPDHPAAKQFAEQLRRLQDASPNP